MRKKRISVVALVKILGLIILALVHIFSIFIYIHIPRQHKSPLDFPNSVWEAEYSGATITLLVGDDNRGYIDRDGERTYVYFAFDTRFRIVVIETITEEQFYGKIEFLSASNTIWGSYFWCTDTRFIIKSKNLEGRSLDFWQTEGPIKLVFYRVSG